VASFNQCTVIGNLTRDVEVRYIANGSAVANVSIAINEKYTTKSGEKREDVLFLECTLWGKTAEIAGEYLSKGKPVLFSGKLKQENWDDKTTGQKRSKIVLNVESMQFLGGPSGGQEAPKEERPRQQTQRSDSRNESMYDDMPTEADDVPF
jgi:single-strand DNA-binding protein